MGFPGQHPLAPPPPHHNFRLAPHHPPMNRIPDLHESEKVRAYVTVRDKTIQMIFEVLFGGILSGGLLLDHTSRYVLFFFGGGSTLLNFSVSTLSQPPWGSYLSSRIYRGWWTSHALQCWGVSLFMKCVTLVSIIHILMDTPDQISWCRFVEWSSDAHIFRFIHCGISSPHPLCSLHWWLCFT